MNTWTNEHGVGIIVTTAQWETMNEIIERDETDKIEIYVRDMDGRVKIWVDGERHKIGPQGQYE